jgi:hypothetical protein
LFSVEMQLVTLSGVGTLRMLVVVNLFVAVLLVVWQVSRSRPFSDWAAFRSAVPWVVVLPLGGLVLVLNLALPLEAADPYHLDRATQIEQFGTLVYDDTVDPKINIVGWVYELLLADVRQIPWVGDLMVRLHGVFGLLLYGVAVASVRISFLPGGATWPWAILFVVPVFFNQLVLIKNDLFLSAPVLVALAWLVTQAEQAKWRDALWAGWLTGFVVGAKITAFPIALIMVIGVLIGRYAKGWLRPFSGLALGGVLGGLTGGLFFTWVQNVRWYGDLLASQPMSEIGNRSMGISEALVSVGRFGVSLADMGLLTTQWWPGRGGWGGTFGLPLIWALVVLVWQYRQSREARWALWSGLGCFVGFAAVYPDADLAHRLVLAPGLLIIVMAINSLGRVGAVSPLLRLAVIPVLAISAAQVFRSSILYFYR